MFSSQHEICNKTSNFTLSSGAVMLKLFLLSFYGSIFPPDPGRRFLGVHSRRVYTYFLSLGQDAMCNKRGALQCWSTLLLDSVSTMALFLLHAGSLHFEGPGAMGITILFYLWIILRYATKFLTRSSPLFKAFFNFSRFSQPHTNTLLATEDESSNSSGEVRRGSNTVTKPFTSQDLLFNSPDKI